MNYKKNVIRPAKTVKEVLIAARWILQNIGWCQGTYTKIAKNSNIPNMPEAFCAIGVFRYVDVVTPKAYLERHHIKNDAVLKLNNVITSTTNYFNLLDYVGTVIHWNDKPGRTKREVIKLFDEAIKNV